MDVKVIGQMDQEMDGWWLPTHGWAGRTKQGKKKKREKEAVCGFLWSELGTQITPGGQGAGSPGEFWHLASEEVTWPWASP